MTAAEVCAQTRADRLSRLDEVRRESIAGVFRLVRLQRAALGALQPGVGLCPHCCHYLVQAHDPNREGSPHWPRYVADEDQELALDLKPHVEKGRRDARCGVWSRAFAASWGDDWAER